MADYVYYAKVVGGAVVAGTVAVAAPYVVLPILGFGGAAGSLFATLQSVGAAGFSWATTAATIAAAGTAGGAGAATVAA